MHSEEVVIPVVDLRGNHDHAFDEQRRDHRFIKPSVQSKRDSHDGHHCGECHDRQIPPPSDHEKSHQENRDEQESLKNRPGMLFIRIQATRTR